MPPLHLACSCTRTQSTEEVGNSVPKMNCGLGDGMNERAPEAVPHAVVVLLVGAAVVDDHVAHPAAMPALGIQRRMGHAPTSCSTRRCSYLLFGATVVDDHVCTRAGCRRPAAPCSSATSCSRLPYLLGRLYSWPER